MALSLLSNGELVHTSIFDPPRLKPKPWGNTIRNYFMKDVMIDLETLGTVPGCAILSIGAVAFNADNGDMDEGMYVIAKRAGQDLLGLHESPDTVAWWAKQGPEASKVLEGVGAMHLEDALLKLAVYLRLFTGCRVWGNGADFDNPILAVAYKACNLRQPWMPYNGRCYRTVKNLAPHVKMERSGTHHHALDDAKSQAQHLMEIVRQTTLTLA